MLSCICLYVLVFSGHDQEARVQPEPQMRRFCTACCRLSLKAPQTLNSKLTMSLGFLGFMVRGFRRCVSGVFVVVRAAFEFGRRV